MDIKKGFSFGLALGFAFGLGCATAVTVIPPARAQSTSVQRWEYLRVDHGWDDARWANEAGQQGWELVQVGDPGGYMVEYFRRALP
jgi:hypothetical protein